METDDNECQTDALTTVSSSNGIQGDEDQELETFKTDDRGDDAVEIVLNKVTPLHDMSVRQIWLNLIAFSVSFLVLFSAFTSFGNLQSTVNQTDGQGPVGIAIIYVSMCASTLIFPPVTMARFSLKWIAIVSMVTYSVYMATGYYPSWYTVIPGAVCIGCGAATLWIVNSTFITLLARRYAAKTNKDAGEAISYFFGIFFVAFCSNHIWGNMMSSFVLKVDQSNSTTTDDAARCGADFCVFEKNISTAIAQPTQHQYNVFTTIVLGLSVVAVFCLVLFMKNLPPESGRVHIGQNLRNMWNHLLWDHRQLLLILPTLHKGMMIGFIASDFTIAFVSCLIGVDKVGFVMMTFGMIGAITSFIIGKLSKYTGLYPLFCVAFTIHTSACMTMLYWTPSSSQPFIIYILAGMWGVGDAAYVSLITVMYSVYFEKKLDTALSCYRLLDSLGSAITFGYSAFLCTRYKIGIIQALLVCSQICITVFFVKVRKTRNTNKRDK